MRETPFLEGIARQRFSSHHHAGGHALVILRVVRGDVVVVAGDVDVRDRGVGVGAEGGAWKCLRKRTGGIERSEVCRDLLSARPAIGCPRFLDLVADAPNDDRGVIAIAEHHRRGVRPPPLVELARHVVLDLGRLPDVEGLVEHQQSQAVARVEERLGRHVVRRADGIEACGLQQLDATCLGAIEGRGAKRPVVVVHAAPGQLDGHAVQQKSLLG